MESIIGDIEQAFQRARALFNNSGRLNEKLNDPFIINDTFFSLDEVEAKDSVTNDETFLNENEVPNIPSPRKSPAKSPRKAIKHISSELNDLYVIHDPIVSLHDPEAQDSFVNDFEGANLNGGVETTSPRKSLTKSPRKVDIYEHEHMIDSHQPVVKNQKDAFTLPFLGNPIQNTITEMQRELNKRADMALPIISPTTDAISCLYNRDQGLYLPDGVITQGTQHLQNYNHGDSQQSKNKTNRHENRKIKAQKSKQEKKAEKKKKKIVKTDSSSSQENRMRELMNIYGGGKKIGKPHSDSTLGSKSSKNLKNSSSRVDSALSKKGKRKKLKVPDNKDLYADDIAGVEISSRISSKRKSNQKDNILLKKTNLKRKISAKLSNDDMDLKLSKSNQIHYRDVNNNTTKFNGMNNLYKKENHKHQFELRQNPYSSFKMNNAINRHKDINKVKVNNSNQLINPINYTKHQYNLQIQTNKNCPSLSKSSQITTNDKVFNCPDKSTEELKLNKNTKKTEVNIVKSCERMAEGDHDVLNELLNDLTQKEFVTNVSQMHYSLPTHSSRMKEAERFFHGNFNSFPFVNGQSTNKSHNLFVNIQETLSLMKQKLPPTIEIETVNSCYEGEKPSSPNSIVSKLSLRGAALKKVHRCPAVGEGLYDIPEGAGETDEGVAYSWEDHPECIKANVDPESVRPRCLCEPKATMSRNTVLNQVFGDNGQSVVGMEGDMGQDGDNYFRELRKSLMRFSQEFEDLNNKYEEMLKDPGASKEDIDRLGLQLENKEEEIKEIIARIKEFKELSERCEGHPRQTAALDHHRSSSTASVQLATLRRVQLLKESLISRPSVPYLTKNVYAKPKLK